MIRKLSVFLLVSCIILSNSKAAVTVPTNDLPKDNATKQYSCTQLQLKSSNNYNYIFEYSTSASFTKSVRIKPDYTGTSFANAYTKPLQFNTKYYWHAKAFYNGDSSAWTSTWSFTTDTGINIYGPLNNAPIQSIGMYFAWYRNAKFTNYILEIDTSSKFDSKNKLRTVHADTFKWFYIEVRENRLRFNKTYYWRLQGFNGNDSSGWINNYKFGTTDSIRIFKPDNNYIGIATNIKVEFSRDNYISYQFEADTTLAFNTGKRRLVNYSGKDPNYLIIKNLDFDQTYYWRMRSCGLLDTGRWTYPRKLKTDGVKNRDVFNTNSGLTPDYKFFWQWVDTATRYQFQIDTLITFNSPFLRDSIRFVNFKVSNNPNISMTMYQMPFGKGIYHRVRPIHDRDTGDWSKVDLAYVINKPSLVYPYSNLKDVFVNATFSYSTVAGANKYKIQRDVSPLFNTSALTEQTTSLAAANLSKMNYNTVYYWRVKMYNSYDSTGWSNVQSFTTVIKPILKSPTAFYTIGPGVAGNLVWDKLIGSTHYEVQYDTTNTFASQALKRELVISDSNHLDIKELFFGKLYFWRVRALHESDTSDWSAVWYFYTYNPVRLSSPANKQVGTTFISLDWSSINGTTGYHYIMAKDSLFTNPWEGKESKINPFFHYFTKNPTTFNTKYYWKIRVFHAKDTSSWSEVWNFTTRKRNGVKLTYPAMNQTAIPVGVNLQWDKITDATQYVVEYSDQSTMTGSFFSTETTNLKTVSLKPNQDYYWRVLAKNKDGIQLTDSSEIYKFTTDANFIAPTLSSPANLSNNLGTSINFSWLAVRGANYDISVSTDENFQVQQTSPVTNNFVNISAFKTNTTYFWRVRAKNQYVTGPWSNAFKFNTAPGASLKQFTTSKVRIYPNPANHQFTIELIDGNLLQSLSIVNALGQEIEHLDVQNLKELFFSTENYKSGLYLIKIINNKNEEIIQKIIIEK